MNKRVILFAEREGHEQPKFVQREDMGDDLRNGLWNVFYNFYEDIPSTDESRSAEILYDLHPIYRALWHNFLVLPADEYQKRACIYNKVFGTYKHIGNKHFVKEIFLFGFWHQVYTLIEFTILNSPASEKRLVKSKFVKKCNEVLEKENSAYRIAGKIITDIISKQEIEELENALKIPYASAKKHIEKALILYSDRKKPDYRNSVNESINAVESIAKEITGNDKATLGQLTEKLNLHHAFAGGLKKIYGYTSDTTRHAKTSKKDTKEDQDTARFMLVTCSAFVNYIIAKNSEAK